MRSKKGFTLVELLVVIAIIALLALLGGANYIQSLKRGRDARRKGDLEQLRAALEMYRTDNNAYPIDTTATNQTALETNFTDLVKSTGPLMVGKYLTKTISDPGTGGSGYEYLTDATGSTYNLCANLEINPTTDTCGISSSSGDYGVVNP
jgi:general secretion pathway protein G